MKILLIEPDAVLAATYVTALEAAGHSVAYAHTAQQAVMLADEQKPGLVILEPQMARHNGIEFLYEFKSYPEWQRIPVIILTSVPPSELEKLSVLRSQLSVVAVLGKSKTSLADLYSAVETAVKAKK